MTKDEALTLALEALETVFMPHHPAVIALKEALAQPAQELVLLNGLTEDETNATASVMGLTARKQRPWVGLPKVDVLAESKHWRNSEDFLDGVYWAETMLKEKNNAV